ncbi:MAG: hypothetical protein EAZ69_03335 [Oscillatoriales cyanobacterium]|nr:MAG: hypothetical protein EAZ69_03335 [Oscillatoriales cyanobacterium]
MIPMPRSTRLSPSVRCQGQRDYLRVRALKLVSIPKASIPLGSAFKKQALKLALQSPKYDSDAKVNDRIGNLGAMSYEVN